MGRKSVAEIEQRLSELVLAEDAEMRINEPISGSFALALLLPITACSIPRHLVERLQVAGVCDVLDLVNLDLGALRLHARLGAPELQPLPGIRPGSPVG